MTTDIPFRDMRITLKIVRSEVSLLLAMPEINWMPQQYAMFYGLTQITKAIENPSRRKVLEMLGAWLRFYKSLAESLPEASPMRVATLAEFYKVSAGYEGLLEKNND